jgi:hypothetical protein
VQTSRTGSCRTWRPRRCITSSVDGSTHCRSSTATITGLRALRSSTSATTASTTRNSACGVSPNQPPPMPAPLVLGEQPGDRGSPAVGGPIAKAQAVANRPERAPLLQLIGGALERLEARVDGGIEPFGDQADLPIPASR